MMSDFWASLRHRGGPVGLARKALRNPERALSALSRSLESNWTALAFADAQAWRRHRQELRDSGLLDRLRSELDAAFAGLTGQTIRGKAMVSGGVRALHAEMLWALVRARRPRLVVETGVCNGLSSAILLEAMAANGEGRLISIDLPEFSNPDLNPVELWEGKGGAVVPEGRRVGWLAPARLHDRWRLVLEPSQKVLEPLLAEHGPVDMFIHDSEHSYENQMFEFAAGYRALASGGLLVATDIDWSRAFDDIWPNLKRTGARRAFVDPSCALVAKP